MKGNLSKIFWGLVFISININIPVDIFPNIIGYGLILYGLKRISLDGEIGEEIKKAFSVGITPCKVMIVVEVIRLLTQSYLEINDTMFKHIYTAGINIISVFFILIMFSIFKGVYEIQNSNCEDFLAKGTRNKWYIYLSIWILNLVITPLTINIYSLDSGANNGILQVLAIVLFALQVSIIIEIGRLYYKYQ